VCLIQNAAQRANWNFLVLRHDSGIDLSAVVPDEFDVTSSLAGFDETGRLKSPLDLSKRLRLKPPPTSASMVRTFGGRVACGAS
jgi:hypothetical protein